MLELHIGQKKRAPSACPECGAGYVPYKDPLREFYGQAGHTARRDVPGWRGFHTWYFVCYHRTPLEELVYQESVTGSFWNLLKGFGSDIEFNGRPFLLPSR